MTDEGMMPKMGGPCSDPADPACTSFRTLVMSLASTAMLHLGRIPDPDTLSPAPNLPMARHTIALLKMLEVKTKGNLTTQEDVLLHGVLRELSELFGSYQHDSV